MIPYYFLFRCIIWRLRTKCQIPIFIVWIFVFVAIQKKKRQQSLFSFRLTTSPLGTLHLFFVNIWCYETNILILLNLLLTHDLHICTWDIKFTLYVHTITTKVILNNIKVDSNQMLLSMYYVTALKQTERNRKRKRKRLCQSFCDFSTEPDC